MEEDATGVSEGLQADKDTGRTDSMLQGIPESHRSISEGE